MTYASLNVGLAARAEFRTRFAAANAYLVARLAAAVEAGGASIDSYRDARGDSAATKVMLLTHPVAIEIGIITNVIGRSATAAFSAL